MKRALMFLASVLLLSSIAMARPSNDWGWGGEGGDRGDHHKHGKCGKDGNWGGDSKCDPDSHHGVPELGVAPMLAVSFATMAGGLALKRRRSTKTAA